MADKHIALYTDEREGYINKIISLLTLKDYQAAIEVSLESLNIFPNDFISALTRYSSDSFPIALILS